MPRVQGYGRCCPLRPEGGGHPAGIASRVGGKPFSIRSSIEELWRRGDQNGGGGGAGFDKNWGEGKDMCIQGTESRVLMPKGVGGGSCIGERKGRQGWVHERKGVKSSLDGPGRVGVRGYLSEKQ
eukprot:751476-Hanusia_phi.AAC.5